MKYFGTAAFVAALSLATGASAPWSAMTKATAGALKNGLRILPKLGSTSMKMTTSSALSTSCVSPARDAATGVAVFGLASSRF
jgi:hypothetical protein